MGDRDTSFAAWLSAVVTEKLPDDLEGNLRALLATPPAPPGTAGSRKAIPKPPKPKKKAKRRRYAKPAATGTYAYESAPVQARKRKAKKR